MNTIVILIIVLVVLLFVASTISFVMISVRKMMNSARATLGSARSTIDSVSRIVDMAKAADQEQMTTPKSLSGVEYVVEPKIKKDFPEFNSELAKNYIKSFMPTYFSALSTGDVSGLEKYAARQFCDAVAAQHNSANVVYKNVLVHKVVISAYRKQSDEAVVEFQAAVQFTTNKGDRLNQEKYTISYTYFLEYGAKGENVSLECPNCGAGISKLGTKVCPFCDHALPAAIERTWKVTDVRRSTYH